MLWKLENKLNLQFLQESEKNNRYNKYLLIKYTTENIILKKSWRFLLHEITYYNQN